MNKRILSLLLVLAMVLSMFPMTALASEVPSDPEDNTTQASETPDGASNEPEVPEDPDASDESDTPEEGAPEGTPVKNGEDISLDMVLVWRLVTPPTPALSAATAMWMIS